MLYGSRLTVQGTIVELELNLTIPFQSKVWERFSLHNGDVMLQQERQFNVERSH